MGEGGADLKGPASEWSFYQAMFALTGKGVDLRKKMDDKQWYTIGGEGASGEAQDDSAAAGGGDAKATGGGDVKDDLSNRAKSTADLSYTAFKTIYYQVNRNEAARDEWVGAIDNMRTTVEQLSSGKTGLLNLSTLTDAADLVGRYENYLKETGGSFRKWASSLDSDEAGFGGKAASVIQQRMDQNADKLEKLHEQLTRGQAVSAALRDLHATITHTINKLTDAYSEFSDKARNIPYNKANSFESDLHEFLAKTKGLVLSDWDNYKMKDKGEDDADSYIRTSMSEFSIDLDGTPVSGDLTTAAPWNAVNQAIHTALDGPIKDLDKRAAGAMGELESKLQYTQSAISALTEPKVSSGSGGSTPPPGGGGDDGGGPGGGPDGGGSDDDIKKLLEKIGGGGDDGGGGGPDGGPDGGGPDGGGGDDIEDIFEKIGGGGDDGGGGGPDGGPDGGGGDLGGGPGGDPGGDSAFRDLNNGPDADNPGHGGGGDDGGSVPFVPPPGGLGGGPNSRDNKNKPDGDTGFTPPDGSDDSDFGDSGGTDGFGPGSDGFGGSGSDDFGGSGSDGFGGSGSDGFGGSGSDDFGGSGSDGFGGSGSDGFGGSGSDDFGGSGSDGFGGSGSDEFGGSGSDEFGGSGSDGFGGSGSDGTSTGNTGGNGNGSSPPPSSFGMGGGLGTGATPPPPLPKSMTQLQGPTGGGGGGGMGGMPFMPPMGGMGGMGGAGGGNQQERERQTWLSEDEDVWGTDDEAGLDVIGRPDAAGYEVEEQVATGPVRPPRQPVRAPSEEEQTATGQV